MSSTLPCWNHHVSVETPEPPYVAVIFTSQRRPVDGDGYDLAAGRMERLAAEQQGYLGFESARGVDGQGISVSYWRTEEDALAWKAVAEHSETQRAGRERWYEWYQVRV